MPDHTLRTISLSLAAIVLIPILNGCQSVAPIVQSLEQPAVPSWYTRQQLQPDGYWVGYGAGETLHAAKSRARADLSASLSSRIETQTRIETEVRDGQLQQQAERHIQEVSRAELSDLVTLRSEQQQGRYYLVLGYDHRPLLERVLAIVPPSKQSGVNPPQLLHRAPLWQQLKTHGGEVPELELYSKEQRYILATASGRVAVQADEIPQLMPQHHSPRLTLELQPLQQVYSSESLFTVKIKAQQQGYWSYIQIFGDGATVLMQANQMIQGQEVVVYPNPEQYEGLVTEIPKGEQSTQVLHLLMLCQQPRDLSVFESISIQAQQHYQSYQLGALNRLTQGCEVTTRHQQIRR